MGLIKAEQFLINLFSISLNLNDSKDNSVSVAGTFWIVKLKQVVIAALCASVPLIIYNLIIGGLVSAGVMIYVSIGTIACFFLAKYKTYNLAPHYFLLSSL